MTAQPPSIRDSRPLQLMLVDEDLVFRSGFRLWISQFPELNLVAEAEEGRLALQILEQRNGAATAPELAAIDLVLLDISLGQGNHTQPQGFDLCQQIRSQYPTIPILCLSASAEPLLQAAAQQAGATGYWLKTMSVGDLVQTIHRVAAGRSVWVSPLIPPDPMSANQISRRVTPALSPTSPLTRWTNAIRANLHASGIHQIESALAEVNAQLKSLTLSDFDRAILAGRQRELRAARKLVKFLLPVSEFESSQSSSRSTPPRSRLRANASLSSGLSSGSSSGSSSFERNTDSETPALSLSSPTSPTSLVPQNLQSLIFDSVLTKLQTNLENSSGIPLETDILQLEKKRELFYLIVRKLEDLISELSYSQVQSEQLDDKRSTLLLDLWQATVIDFFGKYYTIPVNGREVSVVEAVFQDAALVQSAILDKIPGVIALLQHLLFQAPLLVNGNLYPPGNPEAVIRAELLLENELIQVANAVMQPILNQFAHVETMKQNFYDRRLLSDREIERFRNDLSWRYRMEQLIRDPKDIFESKYSLFVFSERGIKQTTIYAPRTQELEQLSGIPYLVTLSLETRDAIAPRIRSVVSFVGNSVVYVLTEVIGRGIGLVGRGIIKGIGNVWQDGRFDRR